MPVKTKEIENEQKNKSQKKEISDINNTNKKSTTKKADTKKTTSTKKATSKKNTSAKLVDTKKVNKTTSKARKVAKNKTLDQSKIKKVENNIVAEYYDLPYRYNETIVKILYQTPDILFVYWDISDIDKENFIKKYGEHFFYNTKPILKIYNLTKNSFFEIEINDFANSWYIHLPDANCKYKVELSRKTIKYEENLNVDYIFISSSNNMTFPNDHILINELPNMITFKNIKTGNKTNKNISTMHLIGINKIYNVKEFYKTFYNNEIIEELNSNKIIIPSSSSWN